jgi:hypothetical protein
MTPYLVKRKMTISGKFIFFLLRCIRLHQAAIPQSFEQRLAGVGAGLAVGVQPLQSL